MLYCKIHLLQSAVIRRQVPLIVCVFAGRLAAKIARKDSLALKLALRPNRQELIARNIIHEESENERMENKEAIGARLIR
jgi:hypothetical protein